MKTLGQERVHADFNPDKNEVVDQIKNKSAELIDLINTMTPKDNSTEWNSEKQRCVAVALVHIETGCMYAVKANFK